MATPSIIADLSDPAVAMAPTTPTFDGSDGASIETFLDLFESCAVCGEWPPAHIAAHLFASLKGAALDVARQLSAEDRRDADRLKAALREHFRLTPLSAEMRMASMRLSHWQDGDVTAFGNRLGALAAEGQVDERRTIDLFLLALPEEIAEELRMDDAHRGPGEGHLRSLKTAIAAAARIQHHIALRRARARANDESRRPGPERFRDRWREDRDPIGRDRDRYRDRPSYGARAASSSSSERPKGLPAQRQ